MSTMLSSPFPARNFLIMVYMSNIPFNHDLVYRLSLTCNFVLTFFSVAALSNEVKRITSGWPEKERGTNMLAYDQACKAMLHSYLIPSLSPFKA
jgi:hypothetical protein